MNCGFRGKNPILGHTTDPECLGTSLPGWCHIGGIFKVFWGSFAGFWPLSLSFSMASVPAWASPCAPGRPHYTPGTPKIHPSRMLIPKNSKVAPHDGSGCWETGKDMS